MGGLYYETGCGCDDWWGDDSDPVGDELDTAPEAAPNPVRRVFDHIGDPTYIEDGGVRVGIKLKNGSIIPAAGYQATADKTSVQRIPLVPRSLLSLTSHPVPTALAVAALAAGGVLALRKVRRRRHHS